MRLDAQLPASAALHHGRSAFEAAADADGVRLHTGRSSIQTLYHRIECVAHAGVVIPGWLILSLGWDSLDLSARRVLQMEIPAAIIGGVDGLGVSSHRRHQWRRLWRSR